MSGPAEHVVQSPVESLELVPRFTSGRPITSETPRSVLAKLGDESRRARSMRAADSLGLALRALEERDAAWQR